MDARVAERNQSRFIVSVLIYCIYMYTVNVYFILGVELGRKHVSDMFYFGELEKEIRTRNKEKEWKFKSAVDTEKYMAAIDEERASTLYQHTVSQGCIGSGVL